MKDNTRIPIGYVCIALAFISWFLMLAWIGSPNEFTIKLEMDNNTKEAIESVEYPIVNYNEPLPQFEFCSVPSKWFDYEGHGFTFKQVNGTCYWLDYAENTWRIMR
ncbi:hypothetical protein LCGC14_1588790 [marine sediment metagenome]|uniref:Uncharacterized protein n=1 Tax=marine sediment metagenome TaxID=412755 RepID=A0A0F9KVE2_9ZZZZ